MPDSEDFPTQVEQEHEELDNPLRAIIVVNSPSVPDGDMEERLLDNIQSLEDVNSFFDKFDETIAIPNDSHIKYEVGSDGLVVIVVDSLDLRDKVIGFIDDYVSRTESSSKKEEEDEGNQKKKKKVSK